MKLTIGMACYKNPSEVWMTVQALRMYQDLDDTEILLIDNSDHPDIRAFAGWATDVCRYVPYTDVQGTASAKERVFAEARGEWVLVIDSHVLLAPGVVARLKGWIDSHPDCRDLLHGPMWYDNLRDMADALNPVWGSGMWGQWRGAQVGDEADPYDIPMHGMGLFACRRDAWLGFNPEFRGFGGEEGYIHEKYRQAGRRVLCLPWLKWLHHFRPASEAPPYVPLLHDKLRNYEIGFTELGLDKRELYAHFGDDALLQGRPETGRSASFAAVFRELFKRYGLSPVNIVETGTIRSASDDYRLGDGWSTANWAWWADKVKGSVWTIDIDAAAIETCRKVLNDNPRVTFATSDSVNYLTQFTPSIDVLYLDSGCWYGENEAAKQQMSELLTVYPKLNSRALILFDDTPSADWSEGRGKYAIPWLLGRGWQVLNHLDTQVLLGRPCSAKISCVMPTWRRMHCVERSISLWCEQTFTDAELVIFNTDAEHPVVLGESLHSRNIKVINNGTDYLTGLPYDNVGAIRRDALTHAVGDYYICWDDDDIFLPWNNQQCYDRISADQEIWAWKPTVSMCHLGGKGIEIAGNVMEASIISRLDKIREFGFAQHPGGGEHLGWYYGFGDKLKVDEYSVPAYSFNWADAPEIAGHKQSSSIDAADNFERHKASCTDIHTRPLERVDVSGIIGEYRDFLRAQPGLFPELVEYYVR